MKLREQIAQQPPYRRRASLPPEERIASCHHAGTRAGMHPEDNPYITSTRSRFNAPATNTYIEVDEEEEYHSRPTARMGNSARRYDLAPYAGRGERRTEELARPGESGELRN